MRRFFLLLICLCLAGCRGADDAKPSGRIADEDDNRLIYTTPILRVDNALVRRSFAEILRVEHWNP